MKTARKRDGRVKAVFVLCLAMFLGVLVGLTVPRLGSRPAADVQQAQAQPPATEFTTPPDDHPAPVDESKPQPVVSRPQPGQDITNSIGMKFKRIKSGTFSMPAPTGCLPYLGIPAQTVPFREPFYMGVYLVTQQEYKTVMGENPSYFQQGSAYAAVAKVLASDVDTRRFPVECVNWGDAQEFCAKLSALPAEKAAGRSYRMPSEWEWEYSARAGTSAAYIFGDDPDDADDFAWFKEHSGDRVHAVGQKKPNAWGLYDMQGNVWEMVTDSTIPTSAILRGGSYESDTKTMVATYRMWYREGQWTLGRDTSAGFRVVCVIEPSQLPAGPAAGNSLVESPPLVEASEPLQPKPKADPISKALAQLSSDDLFSQDAACKSLAALKVDSKRQAEVVQAVRKMLDAREKITPRVQGIRVLAVWGTAAEVPYLLGLLDDADRTVQEAAIIALGRLKDPRAADMLALRLNVAAQSAAASESLKEIGPAAESAVREQIHRTNSNVGGRIAAIKVIKVIGSTASQMDLIDAANDHFSDVAQAAREALPPNLRPAAVDPKLTVKLNVHIKDYQAWPAIQAKIKALADDSSNPMCTTQLTGDYMWVTLGPVKDYDALLRKIDFGKVTAHNPQSRLIYVESGQ